MRKTKIKWLIFSCAILMLPALQAQNIGDPVQIFFKNARQDSKIIIKVMNEDDRGRRTLVKKDTIAKSGRLLVDLKVGNIVFGELENSTATTRPIYINGTFNNRETVQLDPRVSFMDFSQERHKDGQITRYLNTAASLYGVDAAVFNPRVITKSFKTDAPIFQGLADENTVTYGMQNGGYVLPGGQDLTLSSPSEVGEDIVKKYVGVRNFMEKWNAGVKASFPIPKKPNLAINASVAYGQTHIKNSKETDVFYMIEKVGESYEVEMNLNKVVFNDEFITDLSNVNSVAKATALINKYGSHYPKKITYGGMYSQYTIVKETDYYKADIDNLDISLGIAATKPGSQTSTFTPSRPAVPAGGPTGNPGRPANPDTWTTSGNPNSSTSTPLEVSFSRQTKKEIQDIVRNSESRYRAVGGFIGGSNNFTVNQNASPIKVKLGDIIDLVDARILKSKLTPAQVAQIRPHMVRAFEAYIQSLNKPYTFERKVRSIRFRIDEIRVTEHIDDLDRACYGNLTASVTGSNLIGPTSFTIFNVPQDQRFQGIYKNGVISPIGNDQSNGDWKWHFVKQQANADGSFSPISLKINGQIVESDHAGPWEHSKPRDINKTLVLDGTLQLEKFPFHGWEDFLGAHAQPFDLDVKIRAIGVLGMGFRTNSATRSAKTSSAKVPGVTVEPVKPSGMTKADFEKYALGKGTGGSNTAAKVVKFHGQNGISMAQAKAIAAQNGWQMATSNEVQAAFQQHKLDVYAFGMMADGRFAVPVQRDYPNFKKGANIGASGGNQGFFYTASATSTASTSTKPATSTPPSNTMAPASPGFVRIQNSWKKTHYVHNQNGKLEDGQIQAGWWSSQWKIVPVHSGWVRIQNKWKPDQYLHNQNGKLEVGKIQPNWASAMWKIVPVHSGWVRIQNSWYKEHFIHNQNGKIEVGKIDPNWASAMWKVE